MKNVLKRRVLVLNFFWQLINEITVEEALNRMAADAATAVDVRGENDFNPIKWEDWLKLPLRRDEECIHTVKLKIRMPTVIIAVNYKGIPKRNPKFTLKNIAKRDNFRDQYTNEVLEPHDWSQDHVTPLSRGGKDVPENVVLCSKKNNNKKGNKTPEEMGWKRPRIRRLGVFLPEPSHEDHKHFVMQ